MNKCPVCGAELKIWYSGDRKILGCSRITCDYEGKEVDEEEVEVKKVGIDEW